MMTEGSELAVSVRFRFAVPSQSNAEAEGIGKKGKEVGNASKTESAQQQNAFAKSRNLFERTFI